MSQQKQRTRPTTDDPAAWHAYWQAQNQPWRTEPEIDQTRQGELEKCRAIVPDIVKGIYPFKEVKLSRADVEWLLATHDAGRGPVNWSNEQEREREGLDFRGADLRHADLHDLPLSRLHGVLAPGDWSMATQEQRAKATVLMDKANLRGAQLQGADLDRALQLHLCGESLPQGTFGEELFSL